MFSNIIFSALLCGFAFSMGYNNVGKNDTLLGSTKNFVVSIQKVNFFRAVISCKEAGMELASTASQQEQSDLEYSLRGVDMTGGSSNGVWLAGTNLIDTTSRQYYWLLEGRPALITKWCPGQPDNAGGVENCLQILDNGFNHFCWNDIRCNTLLRYVCQYS